MSRYLPLICLALMHTLVDACALLIEPLWPRLETKFALYGVAALSAKPRPRFHTLSFALLIGTGVNAPVRDQVHPGQCCCLRRGGRPVSQGAVRQNQARGL